MEIIRIIGVVGFQLVLGLLLMSDMLVLLGNRDRPALISLFWKVALLPILVLLVAPWSLAAVYWLPVWVGLALALGVASGYLLDRILFRKTAGMVRYDQ